MWVVMVLQINGEDVSAASHEHVVELIRSSGALVSMTVVSLNNHTGETFSLLCSCATLFFRTYFKIVIILIL